jgi:hypothetical protein
MTRTYFAPSALPGIHEPLPGALPQAVTFRAFGAASRSFHTVSTREVVLTSSGRRIGNNPDTFLEHSGRPPITVLTPVV